VRRALLASEHWGDDPSRIEPLQRHLLQQNILLPLDPEASGLTVFSQQREVIRLLTSTRDKLEQEYVVEVSGEAEENGFALLAKGIGHRGKILPKAKVSWQSENRLRLVIKEPAPGEVRLLCEAIGLARTGLQGRIRSDACPWPSCRSGIGESSANTSVSDASDHACSNTDWRSALALQAALNQFF